MGETSYRPDTNMKALEYDMKLVVNDKNVPTEMFNSIFQRLREVHKKQSRAESMLVYYKSLQGKSIFTFLLGLIMMNWGFICWYRRLQVYQDRDVKQRHKNPPAATT